MLDVSHLVRVLSIKELVDPVYGNDIWHMSNVIIVASEVDVKLVVVVVSHDFNHEVVDFLFLCDCSHHVGMNKLVNFLDWHIHSVVGGDMSLEFKEVSPYVVDVN